MQRLHSDLMAQPQAWPFKDPVKAEEVPDYYDVIKNPMCFSAIEHKIDTHQYSTLEAFADDVYLVFDNTRLYNPETTIYSKNANRLEKWFREQLNDRMK